MSLFVRSIDDFTVDDVATAFRTLTLSDDATTMLRAFATAPNRAMSRLELAGVIDSDDIDSCSEVLGEVAEQLAMAIDPSLEQEWTADGGESNGWVLFISHDPLRWVDADDGDDDPFLVVMRDTLASALDAVGFAPYEPWDAEAEAAVAAHEGVGADGMWHPADPLVDLSDAEDSLSALSANDRSAVVMARFGQGSFRTGVVERWEGQCAVTGCAFLPALVATHIKPWADADNDERVDPANGLLLIGTLDRLFDGGFITFEADGQIRISGVIPEEEYAALGLSTELRLRRVPSGSAGYLEQHREQCFVALDEGEAD
jgi:hypothetical protein